MIQPTDKQKQEAREIIEEYKQRITQLSKGEIVPCRPWLEFRLTLIISSRDTEIREVLEGTSRILHYTHGRPERCWCPDPNSNWAHTPACLAARALWDKVSP